MSDDRSKKRPIWESALHYAAIAAISIVLISVSFAVLPPCLIMAAAGLSGGLADAGLHYNRVVGLQMFGVAVAILIVDGAWVFYLLPKDPKGP
jgi:hypothetical protein